jgi:phospholipid transport system transporter-binding protein
MKFDVSSITNENAAGLLERGVAAIGAGDATVDLTGVATVDSAAVALLLGLQRAAVEKGAHLTITGAPAGIASLAELYGVSDLLHLGSGPA